MSNAFDNSHAAAIANGTRTAEQNKPAPTQKPGQSWDSHANELNQYNHIRNGK